MSCIDWQTDHSVALGSQHIPISSDILAERGPDSGIRRDSALSLAAKRVLWPLKRLHDDLLVDGFIESELAKLIARYHRADDVFLEIGCGDMTLRRHLPQGSCYNALDIEFSEFHLRRTLGDVQESNILIASATDIPVESGSASFIFSAETFPHIPDIDAALREIRRIASSNARLICSISNEKAYKYTAKGSNPETRHKWSFAEFQMLMEDHGFRMIEGFQKGFWLPLPWLTGISYQLPISSKSEAGNVNFFYAFEAI